MQFRPCIDLHDGRVKQIVGATLRDGNAPQTNFETTIAPADFAMRYKADDLRGGHVIMLGPGNTSAALSALHAFKGGMQIGGGITDANASFFLDNGASHVIVTSFVFKQGAICYDNLNALVKNIGKERLVLDLSCKKKDGHYFIVTDRWQTFTDIEVSQKTFAELSVHCDEFLVHAADVEGKRGGIDEDLVSILAQFDGIPVTYAGGVATLDDVARVAVVGKNRVHLTIGSALDIFGGALTYSDVVSLCKRFATGENA